MNNYEKMRYCKAMDMRAAAFMLNCRTLKPPAQNCNQMSRYNEDSPLTKQPSGGESWHKPANVWPLC